MLGYFPECSIRFSAIDLQCEASQIVSVSSILLNHPLVYVLNLIIGVLPYITVGFVLLFFFVVLLKGKRLWLFRNRTKR
jgi:hypothetical protein